MLSPPPDDRPRPGDRVSTGVSACSARFLGFPVCSRSDPCFVPRPLVGARLSSKSRRTQGGEVGAAVDHAVKFSALLLLWRHLSDLPALGCQSLGGAGRSGGDALGVGFARVRGVRRAEPVVGLAALRRGRLRALRAAVPVRRVALPDGSSVQVPCSFLVDRSSFRFCDV